MKLYFKEVTFRDYSRPGYDDVFIECSLTPYGKTEEGYDHNSCWYYVEIGDGFTEAEALKLGDKAIDKALNTPMPVQEALASFVKKK